MGKTNDAAMVLCPALIIKVANFKRQQSTKWSEDKGAGGFGKPLKLRVAVDSRKAEDRKTRPSLTLGECCLDSFIRCILSRLCTTL